MRRALRDQTMIAAGGITGGVNHGLKTAGSAGIARRGQSDPGLDVDMGVRHRARTVIVAI